MINSLSPAWRKVSFISLCFLSFFHSVSLSPIARHVSYVPHDVHACNLFRCCKQENRRDDEPVRRVSALTQPVRAHTTGFALRSVKTCRWMRRLAENDGIGRIVLITRFFFLLPDRAVSLIGNVASTRCCIICTRKIMTFWCIVITIDRRHVITHACICNWYFWSIGVYVFRNVQLARSSCKTG